MEPLVINYVQVDCPELELTDEVKNLAQRITEWAIQRNTTYRDCMAIAAPMLGIPQRIMVIDSPSLNSIQTTANLFITDTQGDPYEYLATVLTHPGKYLRAQVHPSVTVSFDNVKTGEMIEKEIKGPEARVWEIMHEILSGRVLNIVDRDFRTVRNRRKTGANEQCPCGSGKKFKRCCSCIEGHAS